MVHDALHANDSGKDSAVIDMSNDSDDCDIGGKAKSTATKPMYEESNQTRSCSSKCKYMKLYFEIN